MLGIVPTATVVQILGCLTPPSCCHPDDLFSISCLSMQLLAAHGFQFVHFQTLSDYEDQSHSHQYLKPPATELLSSSEVKIHGALDIHTSSFLRSSPRTACSASLYQSSMPTQSRGEKGKGKQAKGMELRSPRVAGFLSWENRWIITSIALSMA